MKKSLAIAGVLALSITSTASFAGHREVSPGQIRVGGNLKHANLKGADLSRRKIYSAKWDDANLTNANLQGADLRVGTWFRANLTNANLQGVNLLGANLIGGVLRGANLKGATIKDLELRGTDLNGIKATNLKGCPSSLPGGWVCENNSLFKR